MKHHLLISAATLSGAPLYHFVGLLAVIALAVLQARVGRIGSFWQICWALPGTFLHELAHFAVAFITGGRPVRFSILAKRAPSRGDGTQHWVLGSVTLSRPGPVSSLPSGLAPLGLNLVAYYLYLGWGEWFPLDLPHTLLRYLAVYLFSYSSIPSQQDLKLAFSSPTGVALYALLGSAFCLAAVRI